MDIEEYKKLILPKINVGDITKIVKKVIKSEKNKEQNFREGINRNKLFDLRDLISDVNNRNKYGFRDSIVNNLEMLNYNILRLLQNPPLQQQAIDYGGDDDNIPPPPPPSPIGNIPPPPPPPPIGNIPPPPPPPPIGNIPPPPPPPPLLPNNGFPPPPPPILFDNDDQDENLNPTLPLPPPPFPSSEPLSQILNSARDKLLNEIKNPNIKLKSITNQKPKEKQKDLDENFMINTFNKFLEGRRSMILPDSDEEEEEDEWD